MKYYRLNNRITALKLRLIDEKGQYLGIVDKGQALSLAQEKGLDLIELNPKTDPPVAKITDFGQFKYDLNKKERTQRQQKIGGTKSIRLSPRIGKHDLEIKANKAKEFLNDNQKVRVEMVLRGRERNYPDLAINLVNQFIELIGEKIKFEQPIKRAGSQITALITR